MPTYICEYRVVIEASDIDEAECLSADIEGDIRFCNKRIVSVCCDPYLEYDRDAEPKEDDLLYENLSDN